MTVEEGAKMVISGGLVVPEYQAAADKALEEAGKIPVAADPAAAEEARPPAAAAG
jgi:uncharacterized membrane protein